MITSDEVMLAGGKIGVPGTFYLTTENYYWLLSPYQLYIDTTFEFVMYSRGELTGGGIFGSNGLRPAISLKPGTPVVKGEGTVADPYVIE